MKKTDSPAQQILTHVVAAVRSALDARGGAVSGAAEEDPLVQRLVRTILTHRATLDWLIDRFRRGRVRPRVRRVLWWALAEGLYLDGLPTPVIVDTAVGALKRRSAAESRFANAILRRILEMDRQDVFELVSTEAPASVRLDLGDKLYASWSARFSESDLSVLADVLRRPAPIVVRVRPGVDAESFDGVESLPSPDWAPEATLLHCLDAQALFRSAGWRTGGGYIQDPSTLMAPALLQVTRGEHVGDLCCAPGGKSLLLLDRLGGQGRLIAMDRAEIRLATVRDNLAGSKGYKLLTGDATRPPLRPETLDACLLDVPCSNTGVIRRRPDVRWHFSEKAVREIAELQRQILLACAPLIRPGGRLVYSTCSIEPQENQEVVHAFLTAGDGAFVLREERELVPGEWHDGAYAALLQRV